VEPVGEALYVDLGRARNAELVEKGHRRADGVAEVVMRDGGRTGFDPRAAAEVGREAGGAKPLIIV
jgi:hypothetical protein